MLQAMLDRPILVNAPSEHPLAPRRPCPCRLPGCRIALAKPESGQINPGRPAYLGCLARSRKRKKGLEHQTGFLVNLGPIDVLEGPPRSYRSGWQHPPLAPSRSSKASIGQHMRPRRQMCRGPIVPSDLGLMIHFE